MRFHTAILVARAHNRYTQRVARHRDSPAETSRYKLSETNREMISRIPVRNNNKTNPYITLNKKAFRVQILCDGLVFFSSRKLKWRSAVSRIRLYVAMSRLRAELCARHDKKKKKCSEEDVTSVNEKYDFP